MALKIVVNISKKVPGQQDYSSTSASCSIEDELAAGQDPAAAASRLYVQAEQAVDRQLGLAQPTPNAREQTAAPQSYRPNNAPTQRHAASSTSSAPYRNGQARRAPAPVTDGQLRYITRLVEQSGARVEDICSLHQVTDLSHLSCKQAAGLIDQLKTVQS